MKSSMPNDALITDMTPREYFRQSVTTAMEHQRVAASEEAAYYLVGLLTDFVRTDALFERTADGVMLKPLAGWLSDAMSASGTEQRQSALRRLGDMALFISGVFANSLNRKLVDIDYYIAMGGTAYGCLSGYARGSLGHRALGPVFDELAGNFVDFVDVLSEVSDQTHLGSDTDLLRVYEVWIRTGSRRAARKLRRQGLQPSPANVSRAMH